MPLDSPSVYRPIPLLNGCGKLLKKLIELRWKGHIVDDNEIAANQYGLRSEQSTLDVIGHLKSIVQATKAMHNLLGMLNLDVNNAFNSVP